MILSRSYQFEVSNNLHPSYFERPTPVLIVTAEGLRPSCWRPVTSFLSERGFSGMVIELTQSSTSEEMCDLIQRSVEEARLPVPVMITHSLSTFVGQKFLESFPLRGLVMVCPLSSTIQTGSVHRLKDRLSEPESWSRLQRLIHAYGLPKGTSLDSVVGPPFQEDVLWSDIVAVDDSSLQLDYLHSLVSVSDGSGDVALEAGVVPMLVIATEGDTVAQEPDMRAITSSHGLQDTSIRLINDSSRLPMVTAFPVFSVALYSWLDDVC